MGWTITPNDASINESSGVATITARTASDKEYTITYTDSNNCTASTKYTLKAYDCDDISITASSPSFASSGGTIEIGSCPSGCAPYIASSETVSWLSLTASNDGKLTLSASSNDGSARTASVTVKVGTNTCSAKAITVSQDAKASANGVLTLMAVTETDGIKAVWSSDNDFNKELVKAQSGGDTPTEVGLSYFSKSYDKLFNHQLYNNYFSNYYTIGGSYLMPFIGKKAIHSDEEFESAKLDNEELEKLSKGSLQVKITFNKDNYLNDEYENFLYGTTGGSVTIDNNDFIASTDYDRAIETEFEVDSGIFVPTKIKIPNNHTLFANNTSYTLYKPNNRTDYALKEDMINAKIATVKQLHTGTLGFISEGDDDDDYDFMYYKDLTDAQKNYLNECPQGKVEMWVEGFEDAKISFNIYLNSMPMVHGINFDYCTSTGQPEICTSEVTVYNCNLNVASCTDIDIKSFETTEPNMPVTGFSIAHEAFFLDCAHERYSNLNGYMPHSLRWIKGFQQSSTSGTSILNTSRLNGLAVYNQETYRHTYYDLFYTFRDYIPLNINDVVGNYNGNSAQTTSVLPYFAYNNFPNSNYVPGSGTEVSVGGQQGALVARLENYSANTTTEYLIGYTPVDYLNSPSTETKAIDMNKRAFNAVITSTTSTFNGGVEYGNTELIFYVGVDSTTIQAIYNIPLSNYKSCELLKVSDFAGYSNNCYQAKTLYPTIQKLSVHSKNSTGTYINGSSCP